MSMSSDVPSRLLWEKPYYLEAYEIEVHSNTRKYIDMMADYDMDLNLVIRYDFKISNDDDPEIVSRYGQPGQTYCEIGYVLQRKAIVRMDRILNVNASDAELLLEFFKPRWELMRKLWAPVSGYTPDRLLRKGHYYLEACDFAMAARQLAKDTATNTLIDMEGIDEYERGRHQLVAHSTAAAILDLIDGDEKRAGYELIPRKSPSQKRMPESISGNLAALFAQINT